MRRISTIAILASIIFAACGVDTTGLSALSSRKPLGPDNAPVLVQEYADLQCPACKQANTLITKPMLQKYGSRIRLEFKHFPLTQHEYAMEAGQALECAADQGKFWQFLDLAYERQDSLSSAALREWATVLGLDTSLFDRCVSSEIKKDIVLSDFRAGEAIGIDQTPTYFVNGVKVADPSLAGVSAAIEAALLQIKLIPL